MTRLYIELQPGTAPLTSEAATEEYVMERAKEIMKPFKLAWKTVGMYFRSSRCSGTNRTRMVWHLQSGTTSR